MSDDRPRRAASSQSSSVGSGPPGGRAKKPPACDRCKLKRVLCHPDPEGCPRCLEKGYECITTPTIRKPRQPRQSSARPPNLSLASSTSPFDLSTATASGSTYTNDAASGAGTPDMLPEPVLSPMLDAALVQHLCENAGGVMSHPLVQATGLSSALVASNFDPARLDPPLATLVYCILAVGAGASYRPEVVGVDAHGASPSSFAEVERSNADLRDFGRRRAPFIRALSQVALRHARACDAALHASPANAMTCWILDGLRSFEQRDDAPRPWLAAHLAHLRSLATLRSPREVEAEAAFTVFGLATCVLDGLGNGDTVLSAADLQLLAGPIRVTSPLLEAELDEALKSTSARGNWTSAGPFVHLCLEEIVKVQARVTGRIAQREPLDEPALVAALCNLGQLAKLSSRLLAVMDRQLADEPAADLSLRPLAFSRIQAIKTVRFFTAVTWSAHVLPLYREVQRRAALAALPPVATALTAESIAARYAHERLHSYARQLREVAFLALDALVEGMARSPAMHHWTLVPDLVPQWAAFLVEEADAGRAEGVVGSAALVRYSQRLAAALAKMGYVFSMPRIDALIDKLRALAAPTPLSAALDDRSWAEFLALDFLMAPFPAAADGAAGGGVEPLGGGGTAGDVEGTDLAGLGQDWYVV